MPCIGPLHRPRGCPKPFFYFAYLKYPPTGRTEMATEIFPTKDVFDNLLSCSSALKKLSTPTLPMTRMEDIPERRLVVVQVPEVK